MELLSNRNIRMYEVVVRADIVDGYSDILEKSITSRALSESSESIDHICSFYNNKHPDDCLPRITTQNKLVLKDDQEFKTIYCLGFFKFPWFRRKELSVAQSINSFKNKNLDISTRLIRTFKYLVD